MLIAGIDPGLRGGISILSTELNDIFSSVKMPTIEIVRKGRKTINVIDVVAMRKIVFACDVVYLESQQAMPDQSAQSGFTTGRNFGHIEGALRVLGVRIVDVSARRWKARMGLPSDKAICVARAKELSEFDFIPPRGRVPHDGMAESFLIAYYGREQERKS